MFILITKNIYYIEIYSSYFRLTESGVTEGLRKVNSRIVKIPIHQTITEVTEEEKDALLGQSESSHDYD